MEISPITEADLEQLAQLYQQLIPNEFSLEKMNEALRRNSAHGNPVILGAKSDGILVGTLLAVTCQMLFGQCRSFMIVEDVVIDANHRRKGIGKALMQHIEQFAKSKNCSYVMLITDADRLDSQEFYRSLGYKSAEYCAFKKHLNLEELAARGSRQKFDRALNKVKNGPADAADKLTAD